MDQTLEIPIEARDYERSWDFSASVNRLNISLEDETNVMSKFARYLSWISQERGNICLEIDELYMREKSLLKLLGLESDGIRMLPDNGSVHESPGEPLELYKYDSCFYAVILTESLENLESVLSINGREFYITFWNKEQPRVIAQGCTLKQVEELYLNRLGEFDPVVFLSPNHKHIEIMSLDEEFLTRCGQFAESCENEPENRVS